MKTKAPLCALAAAALSALALANFGSTAAGNGQTVAPAAPAPPPKTDPFSENIRPTDKLSPEAELKSFHVPPGFEVQLVASEPEINKPINIAFDAKGRLWVSSTREYPFPVKPNMPAHDQVKVIEIDFATGKASKVTTFAEGLNIPTGVYPYKDGVIAYSIPFIHYFRDTDGDGRADKDEQLYGPFDISHDTHGMTNSFTRGFDGWLYATHGYSNHTVLHGADGSIADMTSGNIYRMALDGSHVDLWAHGTVNPFGLAFDPMGNLYVADCHSKPIQQVIRDGWYEQFGRPHDGMGFSPQMMDHLHGSTAIGGCVYYSDDKWPAEFRDNIFVGNPVTSRVDRDHIQFTGTSPAAQIRPDFVASDDPWYRPVAMQLGPDGALYVADFYNKIIGHYEVPLNHPGRDRTSGRIWRITYKGEGNNGSAAVLNSGSFDLTKLDAAQLVEKLASANLTTRLLATNEIVDRFGGSAAGAAKKAFDQPATPEQRVHAMWVLKRIGALDEGALKSAMEDKSSLVRVHALRVLGEMVELSPGEMAMVKGGLADAEPVVRRAAADTLGRHPDLANLEDLLKLEKGVAKDDPFMLWVVRRAVMAQLAPAGNIRRLPLPEWTEEEQRAVADVAVAIPTQEAGNFMADHLMHHSAGGAGLAQQFGHAFRWCSESELERLTAAARKIDGDLPTALALFDAARNALAQRGAGLPNAMREWGTSIATSTLQKGAGVNAADQQRAMEIARELKIAELAPRILQFLNGPKQPEKSKIAAARALLAMGQGLDGCAGILRDAANPAALRQQMADAIGEVDSDAARAALVEALRQAPQQLESRFATALAQRPAGVLAMLDAVAAGKVSPRVLQDRAVVEKVNAAKIKDSAQRMRELTKGLEAPDEKLQKMIDARRSAYAKAPHDEKHGAAVFEKTCSVCHRLEDKGANIGPQLDGIGVRGLDRLCEDVLDSNRNVDPDFKYAIVDLKDGSTVMGLQRRIEGKTIIFADATGKEIAVNQDDIKERMQSKLSLMPSNFADVIPEQDFYDLMAYLLSKNNRRAAP